MIELVFNWWNAGVLLIGLPIAYVCYSKYKITKSRALLNCLPGVFTSLGLLGTFLSICLSLNGLGQEAVEAVDNTGKTVAEIKAADQGLDIMKIIRELIPAFTTSILGLILALISTVWSKIKFAEEDDAENSNLNGKSPEEYIRDIAHYTESTSQQKNLLSQLIQLQQEHEEKNREYNDKLNTNISNQSTILKEFIDGFVNRMDDIFKQMHGAIQQQVQNFGEEQFSKTSELLTSITERLNSVSTEILNSQRQSVEHMMNNTNDEIKGITQSVTTVLSTLTAQIETSLSTLGTEQANRLNNIISNYDSLATKLTEQNSGFANQIAEQMRVEYAKIQEHNVESLEQMASLKDAYSELTSETLKSAISMNESATSNLRQSISGFVMDIQTSITTQCNSLSSAIISNVDALNKAYQFIQSLVAEIRQNYDQAVLAYGDAVNVAHRTNESSEKLITATDESLKNVDSTNRMIGQILNILTERQENIESLVKQINSVSATIVELQNLESILNKLSIAR